MLRHWKCYRGDTVSLICGGNWYTGGKEVAGGSCPQTNFQLSNCPSCDMEVTTFGHSPDTDIIQEFIRR